MYETVCIAAFVVQLGMGINEEMISKQVHQEETERLKIEIQQCMDFIQTQQQLLQVNTVIDSYTVYFKVCRN